MIKYTPAFVDKLENILSESAYMVRYERGNFQSGWCLLDHKRIVVLNKFLDTEARVNTLVDLIPQLKIDYDKLTLNSQKIYDFLAKNHIPRGTQIPVEQEDGKEPAPAEDSLKEDGGEQEVESEATSEPGLEDGSGMEKDNNPGPPPKEEDDGGTGPHSPVDPDQEEPPGPSGS